MGSANATDRGIWVWLPCIVARTDDRIFGLLFFAGTGERSRTSNLLITDSAICSFMYCHVAPYHDALRFRCSGPAIALRPRALFFRSFQTNSSRFNSGAYGSRKTISNRSDTASTNGRTDFALCV
jgi:hypothetical protein